MCPLSVVCYQVEVFATGRFLVRRSPTDCDVCECNQENLKVAPTHNLYESTERVICPSQRPLATEHATNTQRIHVLSGIRIERSQHQCQRLWLQHCTISKKVGDPERNPKHRHRGAGLVI